MTNGNNGSVGVAFPLGNRIDLLTEQIALLTEQVSQTSANIDKIGERVDGGFSELKTIAQAQQQDINRLVEVTDRQAKTVDKQAQTVDRLALMLERMLIESR